MEKIRSDIMGPQHDDIKYLKQDNIGVVISRGLTATYETKPKNPIEFFAKWLLNFRETERSAENRTAQNKTVIQLKKDHDEAEKAKQAEIDRKAAEAEEEKKREQAFWDKLQTSEDLNDNLTELCCHISERVKATGVYIGCLEKNRQPVAEDADENAHIADDAPLVLKFKHATPDHEEYMVGAILPGDKGISHELFKPAEGEEEPPAEEEDGEAKQADADAGDILKTYQHKFVKEVVREKKIHYWKVPRLGCFMAIPLVYKSCLNETSLDKALEDYIEILKKLEVQDKEKAEFMEEQEEKKEEKLKAGEKWVPEKRDWEEIKPEPFLTNDS